LKTESPEGLAIVCALTRVSRRTRFNVPGAVIANFLNVRRHRLRLGNSSGVAQERRVRVERIVLRNCGAQRTRSDRHSGRVFFALAPRSAACSLI
jgi:hypothetical protein